MIRRWIIATFALIIPLVAGALAGCSRQAEQAADMHAMNTKGDMNMHAGESLHGNFAHKELIVLEKVPQVPPAFTSALDAMYGQYLEMAKAFASDDIQAANAAAEQMRRNVEGLDVAGLDAQAEEAWASHRTVMRTSLHQLTSAEDMEDKREHFSHISEAMYCALKSFGGINQPIYVAFCPTGVRGHGAYWLADNRDIRSPYMSAGMSPCGEIKETIE